MTPRLLSLLHSLITSDYGSQLGVRHSRRHLLCLTFASLPSGRQFVRDDGAAAVFASAPKRKPGRQGLRNWDPPSSPFTICSRHHASGARRGAERLLPQKPADDGAPKLPLGTLCFCTAVTNTATASLSPSAGMPTAHVVWVFQASHLPLGLPCEHLPAPHMPVKCGGSLSFLPFCGIFKPLT